MPGTFLYANVKLKYGQVAAFSEVMAKVKDIFEARGWRLVGAWSTVIGDINEVHDLWELNDANSVAEAMALIVQDPEFLKIAPELSALINTEVMSIVTPTSYSP